jgi:hypothetical protein
MVKVPDPVQGSPPVSVQVPVMLDHVVVPEVSVVPVAVPAKAKVLPPDCTVNAKSAVGVVPVAVTTNVPPAVLPEMGKHGPVVRKLM